MNKNHLAMVKAMLLSGIALLLLNFSSISASAKIPEESEYSEK